MAVTLQQAEKHSRFAWRQSNRSDVDGYWVPYTTERLDGDWWEPTSRWRREAFEEREFYGGEIFGKPSAPVEGPNNPNRLRRELEYAERELHNAEAEQTDAEDRAISAAGRINRLRTKLDHLHAR